MAQFAKNVLVAMACTLALAGCGSSGGDAGSGKDKPDALDSTQLPPNWKATDACSILGKAAVAEILKQEVGETRLGLVHEPTAAEAATSECTYLGKDGASVATLMTRWSPIGDNNQAAIDTARSASAASVKAFTDKPIEDVPGLGKAAFLVPKIDSLNVFIDDARMIVVTPLKLPDGAAGKDVAIALAKKAGA